jgi:MFS family permease
VASIQPFSALRYRNFRLFYFGQIISLTGTWMHSAAQGWLVLRLTDSPFYLGLAGTAGSIPILLFTLAGGIIADRFKKRYTILTMYIILSCLALTLGFLASTGMVNIWHVLVIAFLTGSGYAIEIPSRQSFFIELVGRESLLNAIALNSAAFNAARTIGPAIAGMLIGQFGVAICFYINAISFLAVISGLLRIQLNEEGQKKREGKGIKHDLKEGLGYIFSESGIYKLILFIGIISFFGFPYITFLPVYARDILRIGAEGLGVLMAFAGAGAFTGAISLAIRGDSSDKERHLAVSAVVFSVALLIFSLSQLAWLSYILLFLVGWGVVNQIATANTIIQLRVPDRLRGRVMSSFTLVFLGMASLGNFVVGSLAHYTGTQIALMICALICLFITIIIMSRGALKNVPSGP